MKAGTGAKPGGVADANVGSESTLGAGGGAPLMGRSDVFLPACVICPGSQPGKQPFPEMRWSVGGRGQGGGRKGDNFPNGKAGRNRGAHVKQESRGRRWAKLCRPKIPSVGLGALSVNRREWSRNVVFLQLDRKRLPSGPQQSWHSVVSPLPPSLRG